LLHIRPGRPGCALCNIFFKSSYSPAALCWSQPDLYPTSPSHPDAARQLLLIRRQLQKCSVLIFIRIRSNRQIHRRCGNSIINFSLFHNNMMTMKCRITESHNASRFRARERSSAN